MLNEEKVARIVGLLKKSSLTSEKQKEWFIKFSDMKCERKTDECVFEFIDALLGEIDILEAEVDKLKSELTECEHE